MAALDQTIRTNLDNLRSQDRGLQNEAFLYILKETDQPVPWAYEAWDELVEGLSDRDNHVRAISAQVLCNLAKSDPEKRILRDLPALLALTHDERFVTARHCMQSLWKVGVAGGEQQAALVAGLETRFHECITEKNRTLIRYDTLQSLRDVYDAVGDESIWEVALALIETEQDLKYRKKYGTLWRVQKG
jgi:hypothetical protein